MCVCLCLCVCVGACVVKGVGLNDSGNTVPFTKVGMTWVT